MAEVEITFSGREEFLAAARALARQDRQLPKKFRKGITEEAKDRAREAKAKALAQRASTGKHTGLRKDVAKGVKTVQTEDGVRVITSMPEEDEAIIPRGFDTRFKGWRHPLFGQKGKGKWFHQEGSSSWFMETMEEAGPVLHDQFSDNLEDAADDIDRSGRG